MSGQKNKRNEQRRAGRRPGDPEVTKTAILNAARQLFGEVGYERASNRAIAASAGVDPALINHHFGGKQALFVAAHELPFDPAELFAHIDDIRHDERGEHIARTYLSMMLQPGPAASLFRTAATNADAANMMREFITAAIISRSPSIAPGPDGERRLALVGSQLIGILFGRTVLQLEPLTSATIDELVEAVGPTIQRYLDER